MRLSGRNVARSFTRAARWRDDVAQLVGLWADDLFDRRGSLVAGAAVLVALIVLVFLIQDWTSWTIKGSVFQLFVSGLAGVIIFAVIAGLLVWAWFVCFVELANPIFKFLCSILLFVPLLLWVVSYALWQAGAVAGNLLLLVPLALLFVATRLLELWRGIFYTCPSRGCTYRGLPLYECPRCGTPRRDLWPNMYGVFRHHCASCDAPLPTLGRLGRSRLARRCGGCEIPLRGRHAGKARESLVAVVGGPGSGKTNYLLMAVRELTRGAAALRGEIDEPEQAGEFARAWRELSAGRPAAKTSEVARAFLLYVEAGRDRRQVYLYDAPGEEFVAINSMTRRQYLSLLTGFVLLVDPLSFETVRSRARASGGRPTPLQDVVTSTLAAAAEGGALGRGGKLPMSVAVVISKADMEAVREVIGDARRVRVEGAKCRDAISRWGGENALRALEHRFERVEYFCCSPLGREPEARRTDGFEGFGVLEPLRWVLTGQRG